MLCKPFPSMSFAHHLDSVTKDTKEFKFLCTKKTLYTIIHIPFEFQICFCCLHSPHTRTKYTFSALCCSTTSDYNSDILHYLEAGRMHLEKANKREF